MSFIRVLKFALFLLTLFHRSLGHSWVKDVSVSYTFAVTDYRGENCLPTDINKGFGGKYVWICPVTTDDPKEAVSSFKLIIQNDSIPIYSDLAKGAGGSYRYLIPVHDKDTGNKVKTVWLSEFEGREGTSGNINQGRGGKPLYFNWMLDFVENKLTTKTPQLETTSAEFETTQDTSLFFSRQSILPTPNCHCNCNEPLYQWAVIVLIGLFCIVCCVFIRFIYCASCRKARAAFVLHPENSFCPNK